MASVVNAKSPPRYLWSRARVAYLNEFLDAFRLFRATFPGQPKTTSMYSFLPDEILKEILSPALQIPDQSFASIDVDGPSPFAKYERSTSAYLLVCKDWLRVATPLLYNVVVLRSKAQIQALAWALNSTPGLGVFIKKLRIESGYNYALSRVFQAAKNLTDLCLSFEIYSQDNASGICRGLALVQPRRVILYDPVKRAGPWNQNFFSLTDTLNRVIPTWIHLVCLQNMFLAVDC